MFSSATSSTCGVALSFDMKVGMDGVLLLAELGLDLQSSTLSF